MGNDVVDNGGLKDILSGMIKDYAKRNLETAFADWLSDKMCSLIPNMTEQDGHKIAGELIDAVAQYDRTLSDLNSAAESGITKEEWLAGKLMEESSDYDELGNRLETVENELTQANAVLQGDTVDVIDESGQTSWNKYSVKNKAYKISKQAELLPMSAVSGALEEYADSEGDQSEILIGEIITDRKSELKSVVAGAIKTAVENKLEGFGNISTTDIGSISGVAVEGAEAAFDAASGKITIKDALEKTARAGVAAVCRMGSRALRGVVSAIPIAGQVLETALGGMFEHMESPQFFNKVYDVTRNVATMAWNGIKQTATKVFSKAKDFVQNLIG